MVEGIEIYFDFFFTFLEGIYIYLYIEIYTVHILIVSHASTNGIQDM